MTPTFHSAPPAEPGVRNYRTGLPEYLALTAMSLARWTWWLLSDVGPWVRQKRILATSFPMYTALPCSEYYEVSDCSRGFLGPSG